MPLSIRDQDTEIAVRKLAAAKGVSLTDAIRIAAVNELQRTKQSIPLSERLGKIHERARALGLPKADFDQKKFFDDMWEN